MTEHTARITLQCECVSCSCRLIPVGHGYTITHDGHLFCLSCSEGSTLETQSDRAGALA